MGFADVEHAVPETGVQRFGLKSESVSTTASRMLCSRVDGVFDEVYLALMLIQRDGNVVALSFVCSMRGS